MKVLFLVQKDQRIILDRLYEAVGEHVDCDLRRLSGDEQAHLRDYFAAIDVAAYDRILFFLRFKKEIKQVRFIRTVPNLVILEHDAYQNYVRGKYQGKFSRHYRALPWARVLSSGVMVSRRLREEGFDCVFVPKGYDETRLRNLGTPRDIELAFVGSTGSRVYQGRKTFLEELGRHEPLQVVRTASGEDYLAMLNRIRAQSGPGSHPAKQLQKDWDADGEDGFDLEVLDLLAAPDDPDAHLTGELRTMLGSGGRDSGSKRTLTLTGRGRRGCD